MNLSNAKRSEDTEQIRVINWCEINKDRYPELKWIYHVGNGGSRNKLEAKKFKQMGVKAGVSDLCIPYPKGIYTGLYIELKYGNNTASDKQREFLRDMAAVGHATAICYGAEAAIQFIRRYCECRSNESIDIENDLSNCCLHMDHDGLLTVK